MRSFCTIYGTRAYLKLENILYIYHIAYPNTCIRCTAHVGVCIYICMSGVHVCYTLYACCPEELHNMKIGEVDQRSSPCIMYIMHTCIVHILRFCLLLIISSRIHQATCLLNHGWSNNLLLAWQTVSARSHLSQLELRRTYVEDETISARRERISQQLRGTLSHGIPTCEAQSLEAELDRWIMFLGVGRLSNGETIHRDEVHT